MHYWCPEKKCKYHKIAMTVEENWQHVLKYHKGDVCSPKYKSLELTKANIIYK